MKSPPFEFMSAEDLPPADRLLLVMHNLGIVNENRGQIITELVNETTIPSVQLAEMLRKHEESGYVSSITDHEGLRRYFLTGKGIIRVSSTFT